MAYLSKTELNENWKLCLVDDAELTGEPARFDEVQGNKICANVPGDWVLDYVREGLLPEPYCRDNYLAVRDYENHHIFYSTTFNWTGKSENMVLRFEGIDTVADIYLNGELIGHAENMYIPHEFSARELKQGENELLVHIFPVGLVAREYDEGACLSTCKYNYEALNVRKSTSMFGWDICPRIVTSGLWRKVFLIEKKPERIENVFLRVEKLRGTSARMAFAFDVEVGRAHIKPYAIKLEGECDGHKFEVSDNLWYVHGLIHFNIDDVQLWWPRGYGEAKQYTLTATLTKNGEVIDTYTWVQGIRTADLVRDDLLGDDLSGDFCFVVNGKRIYIKGTNWVPADSFHSNDDNRIPGILDLVWDEGCNAMRVWGGGVYESDYFYDWCDSHGIVIWQDFMMACGIYPHTERMQQQLTEEAIAIVRRLRHHASICLWAGDNECDQSYSWGDVKQDPSTNILTRKILPAVLHEEDISRPYLPCSPYVSHEAFVAGKEQDTTEQHLWGPRDYFKGHFYHDATAVFASEMGYHGCNSPKSIEKFVGKDDMFPVDGNPMYLYHAASPEVTKASPYVYRIPLMSSQLDYLFGQKPVNIDEYARMSQISQAEAKKFFVECFRARRNKRTGLIWWNIMDCWPQISDAVVDYYFCRKLAYFFIRRSQQPVCLMMDDHTGDLMLYGVNDKLADECVSYRVFDVDSGETIATGKAVLAAEASTPILTVKPEGNRFYGIEWTNADGTKGDNHYLHGVPPYSYDWYMKNLKKLGYDEFEGF